MWFKIGPIEIALDPFVAIVLGLCGMLLAWGIVVAVCGVE